ncbi:CBS domain-containing protein [Thermodesulfobacteriota bacterium]
MLIRDVVEEVDRTFFTLEGSKTVEEAIALMNEKETNALIVYENDQPVGIFTERDVLACYIKLEGKSFNDVKLSDAMTSKLVIAKPEDELAPTISMMTKLDIRHLPVMEEGKITSLLYICDLVQSQVGILSSELRYLEDYLADLQEAVTD